jgi:hypothetical protein
VPPFLFLFLRAQLYVAALPDTGFCGKIELEAGLRPGEAPRVGHGPSVVLRLTQDLPQGTVAISLLSRSPARC